MPEQLGDGTWQEKIRGKDFRFSKWGAEKSLMTFAELSRFAAHGLGDASSLLNSSDREQQAGLILSLIIKGVGDGLGSDPKATLRMIKKLCCDDVFCDGTALSPDLFDTFFREDFFFAIEVAKANLEVQYASFFARLAPAFSLIRDRVFVAIRP